ncbi:hypothetical protein L873DRAFT_245119 [Choiromyces venosus 120613-1]|uniref:Uncharacterized protein n=1 Tax=Choiromyces venosus 120613-1 TaxID=1336337 RepID=A0A3N4J1J8_9PEZI|nr:hypothetical protein L873DRAFT_245119 [Choiromyces venosus 120613-1]
MTSVTKSTAEHEEWLKNNDDDGKLSRNVTPGFFSIGRPTSSYFTPKLAPEDHSTEPDLSGALRVDVGPHNHKSAGVPIGFPPAYPVHSPILRPACCPHNHHPVTKANDAIGNHQELATSLPPISLPPTLNNMGPFLHPSHRPTERDVLAALIQHNVIAAREIIDQYNTTTATNASTSTAPTAT